MRRNSLSALALAAASFLLYPAFGLAQRPGGGGGGGGGTPRDVNSPNSRQDLPDVQRVDDVKFLKDAAMGGLTEVALGKLAVEKGSSDAVKQFGQKMIDDHTKASEVLKQIADAGHVSVPDALDSKHQSRVDKMAKLSGSEFDKSYIKDQQKYHKQTVGEFQEEAQYGAVPGVRNFASKVLPLVQQHLEAAKELSKK